MKYLLLVYHDLAAMEDLSVEERRALHRDSRRIADTSLVVAHYRLRRPKTVTTVRNENGRTAIAEGPLAEQRPPLQAVLLCQGKDPAAAVELALQLPAVRLGGVAEIWPVAG